MGVGVFHRRVSLFRHKGKRSSIFCNEWAWKILTEGFPYLVNFKKDLPISQLIGDVLMGF